MIVSLLINTSVKKLNKVYDYSVKDCDISKIEIGKRVKVSFGRGKDRFVEGIIVKIQDENYESNFKLKEVEEILDEVSYIDETKLKLAKWMAYMYFCNVYDVLKLMLPPGSNNINANKSLSAKQEQVIRCLKDISDIDSDIEEGIIRSPKQIQVLKFLNENEYVTIRDVIEGLNVSRSVISTLEKNGYITVEKVDIESSSIADINFEKDEKKNPTAEQQNAIEKINNSVVLGEHKKFLLFGVTGSGKTEVYLQVIEEVLKNDKTVIVLVPEISLTKQTITRFASRFGNCISMLHSKMTISERKEEYRKIRDGKIKIVIGARSAIFAPIQNLGMVIMDEEHDSSYYSQMNPKYSTKEVASYICKEKNAVLVLGSATPEVSTYYKASLGKIELIKMLKRPDNISMPKVVMVDKKKEALKGKEATYISDVLKNEILINKENGEQSIIFLNRRGYSSYLVCDNCKLSFKCPNCDVALTYHKNNSLLTCHYCGYVEKRKDICPCCNSNSIKESVSGTEKIEEKIKEIGKDISVIRMDRDTTLARGSHSEILRRFKEEKIDVLVGTQMVSKGHDIENVTLVGVLGTDSMLNMNDYLATERVYSNISQVAGRAGRGTKKGRTIIETTEPENLILNYACNHDYEGFYQNEINFREAFSYPPFMDIFVITLTSKDNTQLKKDAEKLYNIFKNTGGLYQVYSPKVPLIEKINNKYRINMMLKSKTSKQLIDKIYVNLKTYEKYASKKVSMTVVRNPVNI